jgi:hypothetical protein
MMKLLDISEFTNAASVCSYLYSLTRGSRPIHCWRAKNEAICGQGEIGVWHMRSELLTRIIVANGLALLFAFLAASMSAAKAAGPLVL